MGVQVLRNLFRACVLLSFLVVPALFPEGSATPSPTLRVIFNQDGLEQVSYAGAVISDIHRWPDDALHIWHMKCVDASGKVVAGDGFAWGETRRVKRWDAPSRTAIYDYSWGSLHVRYTAGQNSIDIETTATNRPGSGVIFDGATIYPVTLHLAGSEGQTTVVSNVEQPGVTYARWNSGVVAVVAPEAARPLYLGLQAAKDGAVSAMASGTRPDALPASGRPFERPVRPGESDTFRLSIRFAPTEAAAKSLARDSERDFASRWPPTLAWHDRRVIGTVFLASSPSGDKTKPNGYPTNPRRYFSDPQVDVQSAAGLRSFQSRVLDQAAQVVVNLRRAKAQGAITWDIEGEQFPQDTSYVCAPDQIARLAPEMESVVEVEGSRYLGMKLDDAYFKTIRDAGFRVGLCIRPQRFTGSADRTAAQVSLPDNEVAAELVRKMRYAHDRWGATLFYLDSTVRADGTTLPAETIEAAAAVLPDSLLMPEEASLRMYRATAPFLSFIFHNDVRTAAAVHSVYPHAFSVNMINDADAAKLERRRSELAQAVGAGDVLLIHADVWQANNATVEKIYQGSSGATH